MEATQMAYIAGFMTGRGGFGLDSDGREWFYSRAQDPEVATAALHEWGGAVSEKVDPYMTTYKYTALGEQAAKAIADVAPYLMGVKRRRAEKLLVTIAPVRLVKGLGLWTGAKPTLRGSD
jgi:hypothetical protein